GFDRDRQIAVRSFLTDTDITEGIKSSGTSLKPVVDTLFSDVRLSGTARLLGDHQWLGGASGTWGNTAAAGVAFSVEPPVTPLPPGIRALEDVDREEERSFFARRSLVGVYLHDEWTPTPRLTIAGGLRWNSASETLRVGAAEGEPAPGSADHRRDTGVS